MDRRDSRIFEEAAALWRELYGEAPPVVDGAVLLDIITKQLPAKVYYRLRSPYLRPSTITGPRHSETDVG
jgi:hypothetical protein